MVNKTWHTKRAFRLHQVVSASSSEMETVALASLMSQIGFSAINRYFDWQSRRPLKQQSEEHTAPGTKNTTPDSTRNDGPIETPNACQSRNSDEGSSAEESESPIKALEKKLKDLRESAKELTSPDDFVKYARVNREANKVEKELKEKKGKSNVIASFQSLPEQ